MSDIQTFLMGQFSKVDDRVTKVGEEVAGLKATITGIDTRISDMSDMLFRMAAKSETYVTAIGHQSDNSQTVTAGGDATVGKDQASVSKQANTMTIGGVVDKVKQNPAAAGGGALGIWYLFGEKIQAFLQGLQ